MKRRLLLSSMLLASALFGQNVWNLKGKPAEGATFSPSVVKTQNGYRIKSLNGFQNFNFPVNLDKPVKITFSTKEMTVPQDIGGHWGIILYQNDKKYHQLYTYGNGLAGFGSNSKIKQGDKLTFTFLIQKDKMVVELNGLVLSSKRMTVLPIKKIAFYGYKRDAEFFDLKVEYLKAEESVGPVRQVAGIRSARFNYNIPWTFSGKDPVRNGMLFANGAKSYMQHILEVPDLKDFSCAFKMTRLKINAKGHTGIIFQNADKKKNFRVFLTGDVWGGGGQYVFSKDKRSPEASVNCVLTVKAGKASFTANGKEIYKDFKFDFPAKYLLFYGYANDVAFDDLKITAPGFELKEDFSKPIKAPADMTVNVKGKIKNQGAMMAWVRLPKDAGRNINDIVSFFYAKAGKKTVLNTFLYAWLQLNIGRQSGADMVLSRMGRLNYRKGDWNHVAVSWDTNGRVLLFLNGLPYSASGEWRKEYATVPNPIFTEIDTVGLSARSKIDFDDFRVLTGAVTNNEIYNAYRERMPIDLVIQDAVAFPDKMTRPTVEVAPGGRFMTPKPCASARKDRPAVVDFKLELLDQSGKVLDSSTQKLNITKPMKVSLPDHKLAEGDYLLRCTVNWKGKNVQRSFYYRSLAMPPAKTADRSELKVGKVIFEKVMTADDAAKLLRKGNLRFVNGYIEAGMHNGDRFAFEIPIPEKYRNQKNPLLLEITWPDDKPRNMALYMYAYSTRTSHHRDRLQSGVQAGEEFFNSNKQVAVRYLFYPHLQSYLFEARTMANGYPAAVAKVRLFELPEGLPALKIHYPEGLPLRRFGHSDEDQTLETSLTRDSKFPSERHLQKMTERLLGYFDYTGQNLLSYPVIRYGSMFYHTREGSSGNLDQYGGGRGEMPWLVESFNRRGKVFYGNIDTMNLVEMEKVFQLDDCDFLTNGMRILSSKGYETAAWGSASPQYNFIHPTSQKLFLNHVRRVLEVHKGQPGFAGIDDSPNSHLWAKLENGYDDYTIGRFTKDTGIKVPKKDRYEFLMKNHRTAWLNWRAKMVTEFIRAMRNMMNEYDPKLSLVISVPFPDPMLSGFNVPELQKIPGVKVTYGITITSNRWNAHWNKQPDNWLDIYWNPETFKVTGASVGRVHLGYNYFETFVSSLDNKHYKSYFQDSDAKPFGRWFLRGPAFAVGTGDAKEITMGAQPLGSWGRDAEVREFNRAYLALPAMPFKTVKGSPDPAAVRYLETKNGTYFYAVNMTPFALTVTPSFAKSPAKIIDLSTDLAFKGGIALKPYELRSFLIPKENIALNSFKVSDTKEHSTYFAAKAKEIERSIAVLRKNKLATENAEKSFSKMCAAAKSGKFAEAYLQSASFPILELNRTIASIEKVVKRTRMVEKGHFAINCGSTDYFTAPNGTLFFPDLPWKKENKFGWFGSYKSVARDIATMEKTPFAELYRSEAYDIDGYRFALPNGKYTVRFYLKCGWIMDFKSGSFRFSVNANGKRVIDNLDLYDAPKGNYNKPMIIDVKDVQVTNGELKLDFIPYSQKLGNARLANAIEVIPQK